jgi:hypothetical protein
MTIKDELIGELEALLAGIEERSEAMTAAAETFGELRLYIERAQAKAEEAVTVLASAGVGYHEFEQVKSDLTGSWVLVDSVVNSIEQVAAHESGVHHNVENILQYTVAIGQP